MDGGQPDPDEGPPERLWRLPTWLANQAARRAYRIVSEELARRDARTNHFAILCALEEFGAMSQAMLSRRLGIDGSDVVAAVNELESRDLVVRAQDERDRRRNTVALTPAGSSELDQLIALVDQAQQRALQPLQEAERRQLHELLRRVVKHHAAWLPIRSTPPET
jgi:DNA-binding MarR family transcriptional regulator